MAHSAKRGEPATSITVRLAVPERDGPGAAEVYGPAVVASAASFELVPPTGEEMAQRMRRNMELAPWLVAVSADTVVGYAYAGSHRERAAYRWSVDVSAYVHPSWHRRGVGRRLYERLFDALRLQGFANVYAGMTLPNDASVGLHRSFGLEPIGVYRDVGYKSGRWHDVAWSGLRLRTPADPPAEPIALPEFLASVAGRAWLDRMAGGLGNGE